MIQNTNGSGGGDRYIKRGRLRERPLQEKGGGDVGRHRRPLQEAGGGRDGGRYTNNALRQNASTKSTQGATL